MKNPSKHILIHPVGDSVHPPSEDDEGEKVGRQLNTASHDEVQVSVSLQIDL